MQIAGGPAGVNMDSTTLDLGAALVAGLAASGHCAAMCGGVAGALAMRERDAGTGARLAKVLA
jgi:sulfite exporter TauE/SafE